MEHRQHHNLIGPQVRRFRCKKDMSQEELTSRLQDIGLHICRQRLARIEACEACVNDFEVLIFAKALEVDYKELLPKVPPQSVAEFIGKILAGQFKLMPIEIGK